MSILKFDSLKESFDSFSNKSSNSLFFSSSTASLKIFWYVSNPMSFINPLCSAPRRSPAPLISKSFMAIWNPDPSSVCCSMASILFLASFVIDNNGAVIK